VNFRTLLVKDLGRSRRRFTVVGVAVAISTAVLVIFGGIGLGLHRHVIGPLLPRLPLDLLHVAPRAISVSIFQMDASKLSGGLDAGAVERLSRIEGVAAVHPILGASFPMHAEGGEGFLGKRLRADIFATGLSPALVGKDVAKGQVFEETDDRVPVLVSRRLLELYNSTVAPAIDKPRLSPEALVGFEFQLVLGASFARGTPDPAKVQHRVARIVGVSDEANLIGITVPEAVLARWNEHFGKPGPVTGAYVRVREPSVAGAVSRAVEEAGLEVDETPKLIGAVVAIGGMVAGLFAAMLLAAGGFGIAQTFFLVVVERKMELAILRALGARRRDLSRLVLMEAAVVGLLGGLVGCTVGVLFSVGMDYVLRALLPPLPFRPSNLVAMSPEVLLGALALGVLAAVLGAALPALRAASANPAAALRG
jgi:putative ABC transport system permease protein